MEDENVVPAAAGRQKPFILLRILQWSATAFAGLVALVLLMDTSKLSLAGAPVVLFGISLAVFIGLVFLHSPPVFFRLPPPAKVATYAGIFVGILIFGNYAEQMREAYERTPRGAKEAEMQRQAEAKAAAEDAAQAEAKQASERLAEASAAKAEELAKVKECLSFFGHYKPLEEDVKGRLHNPHAFEHVSTEMIGPTPDVYNLEMRFRAENGFGALRAGSVRANVNPDTCELESIGSLTVD